MFKSAFPMALLAAVTLLLAATGPRAMAGPWDMDTTYGEGGVVAFDPGAAVWMAALPDGTLLEVTSTATGKVLRARDVDGRPDSRFGVGGKLEITFPNGFGTYNSVPLVDTSGRLLWCGTMDSNNDKIKDRTILRYTASGALDPAFGAGGVVSQVSDQFPASNNGAYGEMCDSLTIQADGRILAAVARYDYIYDDAISLTLLRFNQDGNADTAFGAGTGAVRVPTHYYEGGSNVRVLPNGWITIMDGTRDVTFTASGTTTSGPKDNPFLPAPSYIYGDPIEWQVLGIQVSGDMLLVGNDHGKGLLLVREFSDGSIDRSFGPSGTGAILLTLSDSPAGTFYSFVTASLSQDGERLYIVRYTYDFLGEPGTGEILRVIAAGNGAGQLDTGFGVAGRISWPFAGFTLTEQAQGSVVLQGPGRVLRLSKSSGPSPGVLGFTNEGWATGQENSSFSLRVVRAAGHDGAVSVAYHTGDDSGVGRAGVNYESASGQLRWADGDGADQQITLRLQKGAPQILPGFSLLLDHPQGAALLADEVSIGIKGASALPAPVAPPAPTIDVNPVNSGGGSADLLSLLLLGGAAAWRARFRPGLN